METIRKYGAIKNPYNPTSYHLASASQPQPNCITDISALPVEDQGHQPACVGHAIAKTVQYLVLKGTGKLYPISPRWIYAKAKQVDGMPNQEGTTPMAAGSIVKNQGCAQTDLVPNDVTLSISDYLVIPENDAVLAQAHLNKVLNVTQVGSDIGSIMQAISGYGLVTASVQIASDNATSITPGTGLGGHELVFFGYETIPGDFKIHYLNSWSKQWGDNGTGTFLWSQLQHFVGDVQAYNIPQTDRQQITFPFPFARTLKLGMNGLDVKALQTALGITIDGVFGPKTQAAVIAYQNRHGLTPDGVVGPVTQASINHPIAVLTEPITARIKRGVSDSKQTIGTLTIDGSSFSCSTLERPWLNNAQDVSCIPTGTYQAVWAYQGDMKAWHYELQNVPGRDGIFIHNGNFYKDTLGCIIVGISPSDINADGEVDVTSSVPTLQYFHAITNKQPITVVIS